MNECERNSQTPRLITEWLLWRFLLGHELKLALSLARAIKCKRSVKKSLTKMKGDHKMLEFARFFLRICDIR